VLGGAERRGGVAGRAGVGGLLFGLEDKAGAAVEVDVPGGDAAVGVTEGDGAFEDVGVFGAVRAGGVGAGDAEEIAELGKEEVLVGAFGAFGAVPAGEEGVDLGGGGVWRRRGGRGGHARRGGWEGAGSGASAGAG
jgi:hypothetical protein